MRDIEIIKDNINYNIGNIGEFSVLGEYVYVHTTANLPIQGKVFVGEKLNTSSMEISFQTLGSGKEIPFDHMHRENEEVYVVIKGKGLFIIDDEVTQVKEGSIIRIAPNAKRRWCNNSDKELIVMVIQAAHGSLNHFNVTDGYL
jgi:mannose-6-phosphate isomerase-like protein (cupin superfamily)